MMSALQVGFLSLGVMLLSFFCHEIGHVIMAWRLRKDHRLVFGLFRVELDFDIMGLSAEEVKSVYYAGLIGGVFPLFIFWLVPHAGLALFLFLGGLLLHLHTAIYDIQKVRSLPGDDMQAIIKFMTPLGMFVTLVLVFLLGAWMVLS